MIRVILILLFLAGVVAAGTHIMQSDTITDANGLRVTYGVSASTGVFSTTTKGAYALTLTAGPASGSALDQKAIQATTTCGSNVPQTGYGARYSVAGACQSSSYGFYVGNNATAPNNYGALLDVTGAGTTAVALDASAATSSPNNIGIRITATGGTSNYGLQVNSGQVQVNSSMTVVGAAGLTNRYGLATGSITINSGGLANQALCWKTDTTLSYCDSVVSSTGSCTCH